MAKKLLSPIGLIVIGYLIVYFIAPILNLFGGLTTFDMVRIADGDSIERLLWLLPIAGCIVFIYNVIQQAGIANRTLLIIALVMLVPYVNMFLRNTDNPVAANSYDYGFILGIVLLGILAFMCANGSSDARKHSAL